MPYGLSIWLACVYPLSLVLRHVCTCLCAPGPVHVTDSLYSLPTALCSCSPGHRYIELFLNSCDEPFQQLPPPGPAAPTGGPLPVRGPEGGAGSFMPPQQHQPTSCRMKLKGLDGKKYFLPPPPHVGLEGGGGTEFPSPDPNQSLITYPPIHPSQPTAARDGLSKAKHVVRMRGLPFSAKEKDILDFFSPQVPTRVSIDCDNYSRPTGEAEVQFGTHEDAVSAMQKNNAYMGTVCVCVNFLN